MPQNAEIILEGTYTYYDRDVNFSQENFKLVHIPEGQAYHIYAEILSRMETGEFLKIIVRYEMNQHFFPIFVRIEKSIGSKYAQEVFKMDIPNAELFYSFQSSQNTQEFRRSVNAKHYLTSPAVSTSAIFTLSRKFDATGRTAVVLISSDNEWTYAGPPVEKVIYAEFKAREVPDFKLHGNPLSASHLCLYEFDSSHSTVEQPVDVFLSKHYSVPYQLQHGDQKMMIKTLKRNTL